MPAILSTYRLQFHQNFTLRAGRQLIPYLKRLGVTHVYASPLLQTRAGSLHGYDVINPLQLNSEVGTEEDLDAFCATLAEHEMGLILDIVPNHMALSAENRWWMEVLERGMRSPYAQYFDLPGLLAAGDSTAAAGRLVLPVLGTPLKEILAKGELTLVLTERGVMFRYYDLRLPLALRSYQEILERFARKLLESGNDESDLMYQQLRRWQARLTELDAVRKAEAREVEAGKPLLDEPAQLAHTEEESREIEQLKADLFKAVEERAERQEPDLVQLAQVLDAYNDNPQEFQRLLEQQYYELADLSSGLPRINYRRFFDINELAGLRVEDPEVFARTHSKILEWVEQGKIDGVRIDHIDGLAKPTAYLHRLRQALTERIARSRGNTAAGEGPAREPYIVVEKILSEDEQPPTFWPVAGTTGYETIRALRAVQITPGGLAGLEEIYREFTGTKGHFEAVQAAQKRRVLSYLFGAETSNLAAQLHELAQAAGCEIEVDATRLAIEAYTVHLPVYRTYIDEQGVHETDRAVLARAYKGAIAEADGPPRRALDFLHRVALLERVPDGRAPEWLAFLTRWQQYTGPAMAKGLEDTAFYIHMPLLALNEVGSGPDYAALDLDALHRHNRYKCEHYPHGMNTLSTHDTKRSEDARARLHVLSEMPERWREKLHQWHTANLPHKVTLHGEEVPDRNEEYMLYQSLLGELALGGDTPRLIERLQQYATKALREAKVHSTWYEVNADYEKAVMRFIQDFLMDAPHACIGDMRDFECELGFHGALNSLAQVVLKNTMPGVPDTFQGQELWDFSLVDPDNRHSINFLVRQRLFAELFDDGPPDLAQLMKTWRDGRIKLFTTHKTLQARLDYPKLFLDGDYLPLTAEGERYAQTFAFARHGAGQWVLVAVPRETVGLVGAGKWPLGPGVWESTRLSLPNGFPKRWQNLFTGEELLASDSNLPCSALFSAFPVCVAASLG